MVADRWARYFIVKWFVHKKKVSGESQSFKVKHLISDNKKFRFTQMMVNYKSKSDSMKRKSNLMIMIVCSDQSSVNLNSRFGQTNDVGVDGEGNEWKRTGKNEWEWRYRWTAKAPRLNRRCATWGNERQVIWRATLPSTGNIRRQQATPLLFIFSVGLLSNHHPDHLHSSPVAPRLSFASRLSTFARLFDLRCWIKFAFSITNDLHSFIHRAETKICFDSSWRFSLSEKLQASIFRIEHNPSILTSPLSILKSPDHWFSSQF